MKAPDSNLSVWVGDGKVWIKLTGRANFSSSVDFKALVTGLWQQGHHVFCLDLTDCLLMDSTFLGVLAGLGIKFRAEPSGNAKPPIRLYNPNPRINELLENLGVTHLFEVHKQIDQEPCGNYERHAVAPSSPKEVACTSLEAHQALMNVNPANVPKFKDVAKFLAEDLKRMEQERQEKGSG